ncbi:MAG: bifunctional phosphopantothenoylcysteine decarboxylase/phosphopantothenate--cysteine ligase CoaBC [Sphingomonadales bacterium]
MNNRRILLIIGGGIAAYKCLDLIRRLREAGADVRCILTRAGAEFVTPLALASLSGNKVYSDLFSLSDESEMGHIRLSREADLLVVAPATADLMAKMASGLANDLASTTLLATDKPIMIVPSMNVRMWRHPATRRNAETLASDGVMRVGPGTGDLACGEEGEGRLAEIEDVLTAIEAFFANQTAEDAPLSGRHILVTAGPTHEAIDPVRYLANRSSGKQGYAVAQALARLGAKVTLVSGPVRIAEPAGVSLIRVESARDMLGAVEQALPADAAVCTAAVADWRATHSAEHKIKKDSGGPGPLELVENPDILRTLSARTRDRPRLVVGFAAETEKLPEKLIERAQRKRQAKGCDWIAANDVSLETGVMGGDDNTVELITEAGVEHWDRASKHEIAARLADRIANYFRQ